QRVVRDKYGLVTMVLQVAVESHDTRPHSAVGIVCAMFSRVQPCEEAGVTGQGPRGGRDHPLKDRGAPGQIVDRRSGPPRVPVAAESIDTPSVDDDKHNVWV